MLQTWFPRQHRQGNADIELLVLVSAGLCVTRCALQAFRYQRVVWPMLVACRQVDPREQRPPVEREDEAMPLWLMVHHFLCSIISKKTMMYHFKIKLTTIKTIISK